LPNARDAVPSSGVIEQRLLHLSLNPFIFSFLQSIQVARVVASMRAVAFDGIDGEASVSVEGPMAEIY
jgi:hypothetical protein